MGKRKRARKAYLKPPRKRTYDPYSPYAIRMRNGQTIDLVTPVPTGVLTEGRRRVILQVWQSLRFTKKIEFHHKVLVERATSGYSLVLSFEGSQHIFIEEDQYKGTIRRSFNYSTYDLAMQQFQNNSIRWAESLPLNST